jgi:hypothetical protein
MGVKPKSSRNAAFSQGSGGGRTTRVVEAPSYDEPEEDADEYEDEDEHEDEQESSTPQTSTPTVTTTPATTAIPTSTRTATPVSSVEKSEKEAKEAKDRDDRVAQSIIENEPDKLDFFKNRIGSSCKSCGEKIQSLHDSYRKHDIESNGLCSHAFDAIEAWDGSDVSSITKKTLGISFDKNSGGNEQNVSADDPTTWTPEMKKAHKAHYEEFAPHFKDLDTERNITHGFAPKDIENWSSAETKWGQAEFKGAPPGADKLRYANTEKEVKYSLNRVGKPCSFCGEDIPSVEELNEHLINKNGWCGTASSAMRFASDN